MRIGSRLCYGCFENPPGTPACSACGYEENRKASASALRPGTTIGKYTVGRVLGHPGGFGITYLAYDSILTRRIALKELMPADLVGRCEDGVTLQTHTAADEELFEHTRRAFFTEAKLIAQLTHPSVVRVLDYFEANGTAYFTMEYRQGCTLQEHVALAGGRISGAEARSLLMPILDALEDLHSRDQPILHRDIKPSNIYLAQPQPILIDFGAARISMRDGGRPLSAVITPGFAPYEQYSRHGDQGPWTDVYGCAATLHFLVTGRPPPAAGAGIATPQVEDVLRLAPDVAPSLARAIAAGLSFRPADRPGSASEFKSLLQEWPTRFAVGLHHPARARRTASATRTAVLFTSGKFAQPDTTAGRQRASSAASGNVPAPTSTKGWATRLDIAARATESLKKWIVAVVGVLGLAASAATAILHAGAAAEGTEQVAAVSVTAPPSELDSQRLDDAAGERELQADGQHPRPGTTADTIHGPGAVDRSDDGPAPQPRETPPAVAPRPAILVLVGGAHEGDARTAGSNLLETLSETSDYLLLDSLSLALQANEVHVAEAMDGDWSELAALASRRDVDLLLVGEISARAAPSFGQFFSGAAEFHLRMYRLSTRSIVNSETFRSGGGASRAPVALSEDQARRRAVEEASMLGSAAVRAWLDENAR